MAKRCVLIGPSSSGKTTLLNRIGRLGYNIQPEVPRVILEQYPHKPTDFKQEQMWKYQLAAEHTGRDTVFERALPDVLEYTRKYAPHLVNDMHLPTSHRYDVVFHLSPIAGVQFNDGVRVESGLDESVDIDERIVLSYPRNANYLVNITSTNLEERVEEVSGFLEAMGFDKMYGYGDKK